MNTFQQSEETEEKYLKSIRVTEEIEALQKQAIQYYNDGMVELMYSKFSNQWNESNLHPISYNVQPARKVIDNDILISNTDGYLLDSEEIDDLDLLEEAPGLKELPQWPENEKFTKCLEKYIELALKIRNLRS